MKSASIFGIAIQLLAILSTASATGDTSHLRTDINLLEDAEAAYPVVLAGLSDEALPALADQMANLPDYCYHDRDRNCYK